jgi:hypothetical protein
LAWPAACSYCCLPSCSASWAAARAASCGTRRRGPAGRPLALSGVTGQQPPVQPLP